MERKVYITAKVELIIKANDDVSIEEMMVALVTTSNDDRLMVEDATFSQPEVTDSK